MHKLEEKNQGDHVSAHLIEVVVSHLRKKHGANIANGPSAAVSAQQVRFQLLVIVKISPRNFLLKRRGICIRDVSEKDVSYWHLIAFLWSFLFYLVLR